MGKGRRLHKQNFFKEFPICCFCGGDRQVEEIDHVPGRVFSRNRQWPEGYEFPSCVECNRATREDEKVIAFLARLNSGDENEVDCKEFENMASELAKHNTEFFTDIRTMGANEVKRFLKQRDIAMPIGTVTSEIPLVKMGVVVNKSVRKFGRKLFLALWFKHAGSIFPKLGGMRITWMTNASHNFNSIDLTESLRLLDKVPPIINNSRAIDNQFSYRYGVTSSGDGAAFFVLFRESFGMLCIMAADRELIKNKAENIETCFEY